MTVELKGILRTENINSFYNIVLEDSDGYKTILISKLQELIYNYGNKISLKYYIANEPCEKEKIEEGFIKKVMGIVNVDYETDYYEYSEYTSGTDYNTIFDVDGHNLYNELVESYVGKFIILEIEFLNNKKIKK